MNKLHLVVLVFAVLQATNCSPAVKRNWDNVARKEEDYTADLPTQSLEKVSLKGNLFKNKDKNKGEINPDDLANEVDMELKQDDKNPQYESRPDIVEGDIKLTPAQAAIFKESGWDGLVKSEAWRRNHGVWPREIYYDISGIRGQEENALMASIYMLEYYTCLQFIRRTNERDYLQFVSDGGCWSYLGKIGTGAQRISLGPGCGAAIPAHEIMHALGRYHEQSRADRDTYVFVNFTNIIPRTRGNFNKQTTSDSQSMPYDYDSLMHYGKYAFAINRGIPTIQPYYPQAQIGQRYRLSVLDVMQINIRYCPEKVIRLVDGDSENEGRVEVYWEKEWGTVCDDRFDQNDANVICQYLGYPRARGIYPGAHFGQGSGPIWFDDMRCTGNEPSPFHCSKNPLGRHNCNHDEDASVVCQNDTATPVTPVADAVRLVNGTMHAGRLEVFVDGRWGTVCDDYFGAEEAKVICRQLGYCIDQVTPQAYGSARYGQGTLPILLDDLMCTGDETAITNCQANSVGVHNCGHNEDASVSCM